MRMKGQYAMLQIASDAVEGYIEYIYVVIENKKIPAKFHDMGGMPGDFEPVTPATTEGPFGHCFRQRIVAGEFTSPITYYGTIQQPCADLSVIIAIDPEERPGVDVNDNADTLYVLEHTTATNNFEWDSGGVTACAANAVTRVDGTDADSGAIYICRDGAAIGTELDGNAINIKVYAI